MSIRKQRFIHKLIFLLLPVLLLLNNGLSAADTRLYTVEIEVADRSQAAIDQALPAALDMILVKLSGQAYATANGAYNSVVKSWVQRYGFRTQLVAMADGSREKQLRAVISLDPAEVDQAQAALGLPIWSGERPKIVLWVAQDNNGLRRFLPEGAEYTRHILQDISGKRGVSMQQPAVEADGEAIDGAPQLADVWGGFPEQLSVAASAVSADTILLAAASQRKNYWQIRWNMLSPQSNASFSSEASVFEDALVDGLNQVIDSIASLQSIDVSDQGHWQESIDIIHLPDASAYQQLMYSLQDHRLVTGVEVDSVAGQRLRLVLNVNASPDIVWGELDSLQELAYIGSGIGGVAAVFEYQQKLAVETPIETDAETLNAQ